MSRGSRSKRVRLTAQRHHEGRDLDPAAPRTPACTGTPRRASPGSIETAPMRRPHSITAATVTAHLPNVQGSVGAWLVARRGPRPVAARGPAARAAPPGSGAARGRAARTDRGGRGPGTPSGSSRAGSTRPPRAARSVRFATAAALGELPLGLVEPQPVAAQASADFGQHGRIRERSRLISMARIASDDLAPYRYRAHISSTVLAN